MIQVNITALAELTHLRSCHGMIERGRRVAFSTSRPSRRFVPGPLQPVYYASKSFVVSFSEAIDAEIHAGSGVSVTALCPGLTDTEFFDAAGMGRAQALRLPRMSARRVAERRLRRDAEGAGAWRYSGHPEQLAAGARGAALPCRAA